MIVNQSRLSELEKCPRRFFWRYVLGLDVMYPSLKMEIGLAIHAGLASHYNGGDILGPFDTYVGGISQKDSLEFQKLVPVWRKRLENYPTRYPKEDFEVVMVPEQEMLVPLGDSRHKMLVRLDLLIRRGGHLWVMDHKSASRTGSTWWAQFSIDKQGTSYIYAARTTTQEDVAGWMINAIKPLKDLKDCYEREAFTRTEKQITSFLHQTVAELDRLEAAKEMMAGIDPWGQRGQAALDRLFPQYTHACHTYGNCPWLGMCQTGKAAIPVFKQREPDYVDGAAS